MGIVMFQQMAGFTLLESVLTLTISSITTAAAITYIADWAAISAEAGLEYNQQVASYTMQTHQIWAQAAGKKQPSWEDVVQINGFDSQVSANGQLTLISADNKFCSTINRQGKVLDHCLN